MKWNNDRKIRNFVAYQNQLQVMRWNDGSYWSVKSSIRSSHKKLLSLMKHYQVIIVNKVILMFTITQHRKF